MLPPRGQASSGQASTLQAHGAPAQLKRGGDQPELRVWGLGLILGCRVQYIELQGFRVWDRWLIQECMASSCRAWGLKLLLQ